jgi:tetratricopeptide (TPR) repeat protein
MPNDNKAPINRLGEVLERLDPNKSFSERQEQIKNILARFLNLKTVVALVGAGASIPLGYPSWTAFAKKTLKAKRIREGMTQEKIATLDNYAKFLRKERSKELSAQVMLAECERLCVYDNEQKKLSKKFREVVRCYFERSHKQFSAPTRFGGNWLSVDEKVNKNNNPYLALLELPVRRFITTNYDLEIERALLLKKKFPHFLSDEELREVKIDKIIKLAEGKSFSQKQDNYDSLAKFPIARYEDNDYMVFHCHGRLDEINDCIITEEDYQRWYLKAVPEYLPFRQTLDLTLGSNPILIIGYGLADIDLMRWLRTITANRPEDKVRNPLFCINYITESEFEKRWGKDRSLIEAEADALYLRYGLHVITVYQKDPETKVESTLCDALLSLRGRWRDWWEGLLLKPKFRTTPKGNFQPTNYYHYKIHIDKKKTVDSLHKRLEKELDSRLGLTPGKVSKKQKSAGEGNLAIVVGDGGTGKSWSVQKYLESKENQFKKNASREKWTYIFWSSYYANDVLTGIDRLIEYFSHLENNNGAAPHKRVALPKASANGEGDASNLFVEDRFTKLANYLSKRENTIIVFDGIEKLLKPNKEENIGESISPEIKKFFKLISNQLPEKTNCKIILTTRLFPLDVLTDVTDTKLEEAKLGGEQEKPKEKTGGKPLVAEHERQRAERDKYEIIAPRCWSQDLIEDDEVAELSFLASIKSEDEKKIVLSPLCSLVDGHIFCIALIRGILDDSKEDEVECRNKYDDLVRDVANTPIDRRIYRVIQEAIDHLDKTRSNNKTIEKFVERISLFMHPVRREVAMACFSEVKAERDTTRPDNYVPSPQTEIDKSLDKLLELLVDKNLIQLVTLDSTPDRNIKGYVVHPLIRNYVYQTIHKSLFTSLPSLQLPGLTSAMEVVDPGSRDRGVVVTKSLIQVLCKEARKCKAVWEAKPKSKTLSASETNEKKIYLDMCRGAFSILRSRFCSNTVTRWGDYREYLNLVVELYDTTRTVSDSMWKHNEPTFEGKGYSQDPFAPLYADELAWVYNEIGFASFSMGNLLNAIPFREQGLEISRLIDNDKNGRYLFQSEFNLGTAYIFLGRLNFAMNYLEKAMEIGNKLDDPKLISRVKAYIALAKYLQGNLEEADAEFNNAYKMLVDNPRARGVFYCYHGELLLKLNKLKEAKEKIDQSRHIGEAEYYLDVVAYARLANANYLLKCKEYTEAQNEFTFALKEAQKAKLRRLETGVLSGMSRLAYELNDTEVAKQRAIEALKLANEYVLCLHQTVGVLVLGKALVKEGNQRELGIACLKTARNMAKSQGYFLRKNEAEDELQQLGEIWAPTT